MRLRACTHARACRRTHTHARTHTHTHTQGPRVRAVQIRQEGPGVTCPYSTRRRSGRGQCLQGGGARGRWARGRDCCRCICRLRLRFLTGQRLLAPRPKHTYNHARLECLASTPRELSVPTFSNRSTPLGTPLHACVCVCVCVLYMYAYMRVRIQVDAVGHPAAQPDGPANCALEACQPHRQTQPLARHHQGV